MSEQSRHVDYAVTWTAPDVTPAEDAKRLLLEFIGALARADARRDAAEVRACR